MRKPDNKLQQEMLDRNPLRMHSLQKVLLYKLFGNKTRKWYYLETI